jgi:hypothetical protein
LVITASGWALWATDGIGEIVESSTFRVRGDGDPSRMLCLDPDELLRPADLGLTGDECALIADGLAQWGGPASAAYESAVLASYPSSDAMRAGIEALRCALEDRLSRRDWKRVLILTELIFSSDVFGAGVEWEMVTGRDEIADFRLLREVQRKLTGVCP